MAIHVRPSNSRVVHVKPRPVINVRREPTTYAKQQGWVRKDNVWHGYYRTRFGSFKGQIEENKYTKDLEFFIFDPPQEVLSGEHGACFRKRRGKYHIHFSYRPGDIDSGIREIERIIRESIERARR